MAREISGNVPSVPANGCLATLLVRWSSKKIEGSSQQQSGCLGNPSRPVRGNLRFPLTLTYHGCPRASPTPTYFSPTNTERQYPSTSLCLNSTYQQSFNGDDFPKMAESILSAVKL